MTPNPFEMFRGTTIHLTKTIGLPSYGVGQVALNLPKAQLELVKAWMEALACKS